MKQKFLIVHSLGCFLFILNFIGKSQTLTPVDNSFLKGKHFNNITLELSLKPFKKSDKQYIKKIATEMFKQWLIACRVSKGHSCKYPFRYFFWPTEPAFLS